MEEKEKFLQDLGFEKHPHLGVWKKEAKYAFYVSEIFLQHASKEDLQGELGRQLEDFAKQNLEYAQLLKTGNFNIILFINSEKKYENT
jgi:hypothetical protein